MTPHRLPPLPLPQAGLPAGREVRAAGEAAEQFTRDGAHVVPVRADLADAGGVETVWKAVEEGGRPLAAAVLNAGRSIGGAFLDTDLDHELSLNITSVVHLAKHVARHMAAHHAGRIKPRPEH
ncbi:SDR family NAD(P)-dependent oxidoreductase [Streptomyces sp. NPDC088254]|uniref:SDR family NAD(P)-dependent oxidoreductase n=1 Tax=Streptomyces sp. NPDC088254 TaxID=3365847 RepID=UPI0038025AF5